MSDDVRSRRRSQRTVWLAVIAAILLLVGMTLVGAPAAALAGSGVALLVVVLLVAWQTRPTIVEPDIVIRQSDPRVLPAQASAWLADRRAELPALAAELAGALCRRLAEIQPQVERLGEDAPAGQAIRKLLAVELPSLVEVYVGVPALLRAVPGADGRSADAHLLDGLRLVDGEVARLTEQLAREALDDVATQGRYLHLKYDGMDQR